jgi:hypothetical protein
MNVCIDAAGRGDQPLACDHFGTGTDDDVHAGLDVGVTAFADGNDASGFQADVGFDDAPVIDD